MGHVALTPNNIRWFGLTSNITGSNYGLVHCALASVKSRKPWSNAEINVYVQQCQATHMTGCSYSQRDVSIMLSFLRENLSSIFSTKSAMAVQRQYAPTKLLMGPFVNNTYDEHKNISNLATLLTLYTAVSRVWAERQLRGR